VAIIFAYLRKSGRHELAKAVALGVVAAVLVSVGAACSWRGSNQALWEGILAWAPQWTVTTFTVHMWRGPAIEGNIEAGWPRRHRAREGRRSSGSWR